SEGDPPVKLSATAFIEVSKIAFSDEREFTICKGENQELNVVPEEIYSYSWWPNENITSTSLPNPIVYPSETTTYTAVGKLKYCTDTAEFIVNVNPLPLNELDFEYVFCKGDSLTLNPGEHASYLWSTGETTQSINIAVENWYAVTLTNEYNCKTHDSVGVWWSLIPELDYGELQIFVCGSKEQTLNLSFTTGSASTNLIPIQADKSRVENAGSLNPTITVDEFGIYQFQMEVTNEISCEFLDTIHIEFHNQPKAEFFLDEEKCHGYNLDLHFTGTTFEDAEFSWYSNGEVFHSEIGLDSIIIPLGYGETNRTVGLKVNEQGCIDSTEQGVTVIPAMDFWIEENPDGCTPLNVQFGNKDIEEIKEYYWEFGDGNTSDISNPTNTYYNPGTSDLAFDVSLKVVSVEDCENTGILENAVVVHPIPTIDLSFEENNCQPEYMEIWYKGSANNNDNFHWNLQEFQTDEIINNPGTTMGPLEIKRRSEPNVNIGLQVISEFGCKSDSITKRWKRKPVFEVFVDQTEGCPPLKTGIKAEVLDMVDEVDFYYNLGDGTTGGGDSVFHKYNLPNTKNEIRFVGISKTTGCSDTVIFNEPVFVYPVPEANYMATPEDVLISDPEIYFENQSTGALSYEWDFDDESFNSTEESPTHRFNYMGFYNVLLTAYNDLGCTDSISHQVAVAFDKLFPPNAFSPNAINEEDKEFRIHSEGVLDDGYNLLIFNRWGQVVFESSSQTIGWDGKMKNGNFAPAGVYTWVLKYFDFRGEKHKQQGTVTLIF
ncbi:MAG: PKD domain-containing protein, partial [Draconibacterium sp.]|nr:PKD domain-containing protein [Draconibacterium sp.]